jgi:ribosomal protein L16/L10AE
MRVRKKPQKLVITGRPKHRHSPKGHALSWRSSRNLFLRSVGNGEISESVLKAFRKALLNKNTRKLFIFRANPFLELTKKPQEVRMGKGRGTKIQKRIFPYVPGQVLVEVRRLGILKALEKRFFLGHFGRIQAEGETKLCSRRVAAY